MDVGLADGMLWLSPVGSTQGGYQPHSPPLYSTVAGTGIWHMSCIRCPHRLDMIAANYRTMTLTRTLYCRFHADCVMLSIFCGLSPVPGCSSEQECAKC